MSTMTNKEAKMNGQYSVDILVENNSIGKSNPVDVSPL